MNVYCISIARPGGSQLSRGELPQRRTSVDMHMPMESTASYGLQQPFRRAQPHPQPHHQQQQQQVPSNQPDSDACFHRGSYIELSSGAMRRVEDIRTEDFIQSALRSHMFDLREATVVRIDRGGAPSQGVIITFSYDTRHAKVHMEVLPGHPLFVYGQGWASCNPQLSLQLYELKCQQLQVGDICLSLVPREQPAPPPPPSLPAAPRPRAPPPRQPVEYNPPAGAMPPPFKHPYQVYAQMANFVAVYTQHMINKLKD